MDQNAHPGQAILKALVKFLTLPSSDLGKAEAMEELNRLTHGNVDTLPAYMAKQRLEQGKDVDGLNDPYLCPEYGISFLLRLIKAAKEASASGTHSIEVSPAAVALNNLLEEEARTAAYHKSPMGMSAMETSLMYPHMGNTELQRCSVFRKLDYATSHPGHYNLFMLASIAARGQAYKAKGVDGDYQKEIVDLLDAIEAHENKVKSKRGLLFNFDTDNLKKSLEVVSFQRDNFPSEPKRLKTIGSPNGQVKPYSLENMAKDFIDQANIKAPARANAEPQAMSFGHMLWAPAFTYDFSSRKARRKLENDLVIKLREEFGDQARAKAKEAIAQLVKRHGRKVVVSEHHTTLHLLNNQKVSPPEEFVQPAYRQLKAMDWDEKEFVPTLDTIQQKKDYLTLWANYAGCNDLFEKMMEKIETMPEEEQKSNLDLIITTLNKGEQEPDNSQDHIPARLTRYDYATTGNANMPDVTFRANDSGGVNVYTTRDAQHTDETLLCVVERSQSGRFVAYPSTAIDMDLHQKLMLIADTSYSVLQAQILTLVFKNEPYHLYNRAVEPKPASGGR